MSVFSTSAAGATSGVGTTPSTSSTTSSTLGSEQFMMLLLAQLRNQNPLEPMQDKDLMAQVTQLNSLQELQKINAGIQNMGKSNQLTESASLIGKTVEVDLGNEKTQTGVVTGVSLTNGQIMLWMGDSSVPLSSLITVKEGSSSHG